MHSTRDRQHSGSSRMAGLELHRRRCKRAGYRCREGLANGRRPLKLAEQHSAATLGSAGMSSLQLNRIPCSRIRRARSGFESSRTVSGSLRQLSATVLLVCKEAQIRHGPWSDICYLARRRRSSRQRCGTTIHASILATTLPTIDGWHC